MANLFTADVLPARSAAASPGREEGQRLPGGLPGDAVLLLAVRRDVRVLPRLSGLLLLSGERVLEGGRGCTHKQRNADELRRSLHTHTHTYLSYLFIREISTMVMGFTTRKEGLWGAQLVVF